MLLLCNSLDIGLLKKKKLIVRKKHIKHHLHHFLVYSSMVLNTFILFCNRSLKRFHLEEMKLSAH